MTVPVEEVPPATEVGLIATLATVGAVTVSVAVLEPFREAVIVTLVLVATATVVAVKVAVVAPAATATDAGTVVEELLAFSETVDPPVGAADPRVTVPVELEPPATLAGDTVTDETVGGVTVTTAVKEVLFAVAVMVELVEFATAVVVAVIVAVVAPAATVTEAGTTTAEALLFRLTTRPPVGAALLIVTVPVEEAPPATEVGLIVNADITGPVSDSVAVAVPLSVPVMVTDVVV